MDILTNQDNKSEEIKEKYAKWRRKFLVKSEIWALHHGICHTLQDNRRTDIIIGLSLVHADKSLEETNDNNAEESEKYQALLHHDFQDD
jgi:hypothetical protein